MRVPAMFKTEVPLYPTEAQHYADHMESAPLLTAASDSFMLHDFDLVVDHIFQDNQILHDDTTMDVANITDSSIMFAPSVKPEEFHPLTTYGPPDRTNFAGNYNFTIEINAKDIHKKKYLYSHRLHRIYVGMKSNFSIQFKWDHSTCPRPMYVRAMTVFSDESQAEKRVERCVQHTYETDMKHLEDKVLKNVLHSARETATEGVYYCGEPARADSWYSVVVAFPCAAPAPYSHAYQFVCKNSCSNGINRRAIDIIFTLEDASGVVHGRHVVGVRVCACPKRDMVKDEEADGLLKSGKKRSAGENQPNTQEVARTKKVKIEVKAEVEEDAEVIKFTSPFGEATVVGMAAYATGLEMMLRMAEQAAHHVRLRKPDPKVLDKHNKSIASLKAQLEEIKTKHPS